MVYKKTTWYSFITPIRVGAIASGASGDWMNAFGRFASLLGVAFQIQDDVLNLVGTGEYGKESAGDLWEGKHTLILIHAMRCARPRERKEALRILQKPRPPTESRERRPAGRGLPSSCSDLRAAGKVEPGRVRPPVGGRRQTQRGLYKTPEDIEFLRELIERYDGIGIRVPRRRTACGRRSAGFRAN